MDFSDNIIMGNSNGTIEETYVALNIANTGNKSIIIQNWGFVLDDGSTFQVLNFLCDNNDSMINPKLPYTLEPESSLSLYYRRIIFYNSISSLVNDKSLDKNQNLTVYFKDGLNTIHKHKTEFKVSKYI